jgi:hypothetical protein
MAGVNDPLHYERYGCADLGECIQGDLKAPIYGQARRVLETTFFGYRGVLGGFGEPWNMRLSARRTISDSSGVFSRR